MSENTSTPFCPVCDIAKACVQLLDASGDYDAWKAASFSVPWCYENFIQARTMRRAQDVRKQLITIMDRYKLDLVSAGSNWKKIQMMQLEKTLGL